MCTPYITNNNYNSKLNYIKINQNTPTYYIFTKYSLTPNTKTKYPPKNNYLKINPKLTTYIPKKNNYPYIPNTNNQKIYNKLNNNYNNKINNILTNLTYNNSSNYTINLYINKIYTYKTTKNFYLINNNYYLNNKINFTNSYKTYISTINNNTPIIKTKTFYNPLTKKYKKKTTTNNSPYKKQQYLYTKKQL